MCNLIRNLEDFSHSAPEGLLQINCSSTCCSSFDQSHYTSEILTVELSCNWLKYNMKFEDQLLDISLEQCLYFASTLLAIEFVTDLPLGQGMMLQPYLLISNISLKFCFTCVLTMVIGAWPGVGSEQGVASVHQLVMHTSFRLE